MSGSPKTAERDRRQPAGRPPPGLAAALFPEVASAGPERRRIYAHDHANLGRNFSFRCVAACRLKCRHSAAREPERHRVHPHPDRLNTRRLIPLPGLWNIVFCRA